MNKNGRLLFIDPENVTYLKDARITVNPAQKQEIVMIPDREWEGTFIAFYLTVIEEQGRLRMWYTCRGKAETGKGAPNLAYAESVDGVNWTKPDLGIIEYKGSKKNNLVGIPHMEGCVLLDEHAPEGERYKYISSVTQKGLIVYTSPDGIHWTGGEEAILPFHLDTQNIVFWDSNIKKYVLYLRSWKIESSYDYAHRKRYVSRIAINSINTPLGITPIGKYKPEKPDKVPHLTEEMPVVFGTDAYDPPESDIYTMAALQYPVDPTYYLAFPGIYNHFAEPVPGKFLNDGRVEVYCIGSRDGVKWHRYDRSPYLKPGLEGSNTANMVYIGQGIIQRNNELWQYGTGYRTTHGDLKGRMEKTDGVIFRLVQRMDGFVSADTDYRGGSFTTKTVCCSGTALVLNLDTGVLGSAKVEILDADGFVITGYSKEECDVIHTNRTDYKVTWNGKSDLAVLRNKIVGIRMISYSSKVYSIRFENR